MSGSFHIATVSGIPVKIHWTFALLPLLVIAMDNSRQPLNLWAILISIGIVLSVFFCVILHEFGHALAARKYGVKTFDIVMTPIGGIARLERMPEGKGQEFWVALAGPVVNFIIVGLIWLGFFIFKQQSLDVLSLQFWRYEGHAPSYFFILLLANGYLGVFNLLPAFPMDGGRMLRSLLSLRLSKEKATAIASVIGQILAFGMFALGVYRSQPTMALIGVFIFFAARQENRFLQRQSKLNRLTAGEIMDPIMHMYFLGQPIHSIRDAINSEQDSAFIIWSRPGVPAGYSTKELIAKTMEANPFALVDEAIASVPYVVAPDTKVLQVIALMQQHHMPIVLIADMFGYKGVVTKEKMESVMN